MNARANPKSRWNSPIPIRCWICTENDLNQPIGRADFGDFGFQTQIDEERVGKSEQSKCKIQLESVIWLPVRVIVVHQSLEKSALIGNRAASRSTEWRIWGLLRLVSRGRMEFVLCDRFEHRVVNAEMNDWPTKGVRLKNGEVRRK